MKRTIFAFIMACLTLAAAAQDDIQVKYKGAKPTINDFVSAYLSQYSDDDEECDQEAVSGIIKAWDNHNKGIKQEKGETLTVDKANGFLLYESKYERFVSRMEMCYWNEADGKHKLFAVNRTTFQNGLCIIGQYDGVEFYRYDNATKKMTYCDAPFEDIEHPAGVNVSYALPHVGKNIIVTYWNKRNKKEKILKWNGRRFTY